VAYNDITFVLHFANMGSRVEREKDRHIQISMASQKPFFLI